MAVLRRVQPGEPLKIPAAVYNEVLGLIEAARAGGTSGGGGHAGAPCAGVIRLLNDSQTDMDRFGVLGIDGPVFDPAQEGGEPGFTDSGVLSAVVPTALHAGRFAVPIEPIPAGQVGRAVVWGLTVARVNMKDLGDLWADAQDGLTVLQSGPAGAAQVLWAEPLAEGESYPIEKWAVVRLGPPRGFTTARLEGLSVVHPFGPHNWYSVCPCDVDGNRTDPLVTYPCLCLYEVWQYYRYGQVPPPLTETNPDVFNPMHPEYRPIIAIFDGSYQGRTVKYFVILDVFTCLYSGDGTWIGGIDPDTGQEGPFPAWDIETQTYKFSHLGPGATDGQFDTIGLSDNGNSVTITKRTLNADHRGHVTGMDDDSSVEIPKGANLVGDGVWIQIDDQNHQPPQIEHIGPDVNVATTVTAVAAEVNQDGTQLTLTPEDMDFDTPGHLNGHDPNGQPVVVDIAKVAICGGDTAGYLDDKISNHVGPSSGVEITVYKYTGNAGEMTFYVPRWSLDPSEGIFPPDPQDRSYLAVDDGALQWRHLSEDIIGDGTWIGTEVVNNQLVIKHLTHGPEVARQTVVTSVQIDWQNQCSTVCTKDIVIDADGHAWFENTGP